MDAIDGKHARNTNKQSPLGQLFDHGLDCFSYCFTAILACQGLKSGDSLVALAFELFTFVLLLLNIAYILCPFMGGITYRRIYNACK
jgi:phosphatidylglycerophosphate synthase